MGAIDLKVLFSDRKVKLIFMLLVVSYVVIFHVFHMNIWSITSKKYFRGKVDWLNIWNAQEDSEKSDHFSMDVHREGDSSSHWHIVLNERGNDALPTVAIGSGITSKRQETTPFDKLAKNFQLFSKFLPSFCKTASLGFKYHFYFAFDETDTLFRNPEFLSKFTATFHDIASKLCSHLGTVSLHMVQCNHSGKPAWAQNDAMMEAYLDNVDFYYRVNDDTVMETRNWTQIFVEVLNGLKPPRIGVVGPKHSGGNLEILTYDFVHRTHVDMFGFYYPRIFTDWYADGWITRVYRPYRSIKVSRVHLAHTQSLGKRYQLLGNRGNLQAPRVKSDKIMLSRFVNYTRTKETISVDGRKVISMSLYGHDPKYIWGAIRNAQLSPIFFPDWKLRVYVPGIDEQLASNNNTFQPVPERILRKLKQLGAEIVYVKAKSIPPVFWRYLVIDDESVDYFIVRNAQSRLNERDANVVNDWLNNQHLESDANSLHCIRDHPDHANRSIVEGLWGGNRKVVQRMLDGGTSNVTNRVADAQSKSLNDTSGLILRLVTIHKNSDTFNILADIVWPLMSSKVYCHDSIACHKWTNSHKFPVQRVGNEYLGQVYDQHQEVVERDSAWIKQKSTNEDTCT